jgi:hypothetical protein
MTHWTASAAAILLASSPDVASAHVSCDAILRRLALNILRSHPGPTSIRRKIKRAGWDDNFLLAMLGHMR